MADNIETWPGTLADLHRHAAPGEAILRACAGDYYLALAQGRVAEWARMSHSIIDLLAAEAPLVHKQRDT